MKKGSKHQQLVESDDARFIKKAFELKAYDQLSNTQIQQRLEELGFKIRMQKLCDVLKNPFYCGYIAHKLLEGKVVKGSHPPIITEQVFFVS